MSLSCDCNHILIGCFLIRIQEGTSIMYASLMHMRVLLYIIMTQLQSVMTAIHEYGIYETCATLEELCPTPLEGLCVAPKVPIRRAAPHHLS